MKVKRVIRFRTIIFILLLVISISIGLLAVLSPPDKDYGNIIILFSILPIFLIWTPYWVVTYGKTKIYC